MSFASKYNAPCRICGSDNLKLYYTQGNNNEFRYYRCNNCGLVNYDLAGGINQGKYSDEYIDPDDRTAKTNISQAETYKYIQKVTKNTKGRLLDIGCGNGTLLNFAMKDGWEVRGIELYDYFAEKVRKRLGIDILAYNFLDYNPDDDMKYDVVVMRHVLEHLPDSITAISKIREMLNTNGIAILEFPNIDGIEMKLKRFLNQNGIVKKKYSQDYIPGHCNEFNKKSFQYLLNITDMKFLNWQTYSSKQLINIIYKLLPAGNKVRVAIRKGKGIN